MKILFTILLSVLLVSGARAGSLPNPETIESALARFKAVYPARCEKLMQQMRLRMTPVQIEKQKRELDVLKTYATNIHGTVSDAERALENKAGRIKFLQELNNLRVDITGFRRTLDALIIETPTAKSQPGDEFMDEVHKFWKDEYYFSWRFSAEIENWLAEKK